MFTVYHLYFFFPPFNSASDNNKSFRLISRWQIINDIPIEPVRSPWTPLSSPQCQSPWLGCEEAVKPCRGERCVCVGGKTTNYKIISSSSFCNESRGLLGSISTELKQIFFDRSAALLLSASSSMTGCQLVSLQNRTGISQKEKKRLFKAHTFPHTHV